MQNKIEATKDMNLNTAQVGTAGQRRDILVDTAARGDAAATVSIGSISEQDWYISRTHGVYHIPGCAKGEAYALLIITARQIAEDLLQDLHDHGIFICEGARPSSAELATATARREGFYQKLITEGDTMWARGHSFREISDLHRRAAIGLGIEREWAYVPMRMSECPACGEKVKVGVAVCRHCSAILDEEKAAKHGLGAGAAAARATRLNANGAPSTEKKSRA